MPEQDGTEKTISRMLDFGAIAGVLTMGAIAGSEFIERREADMKLDDVERVMQGLQERATMQISTDSIFDANGALEGVETDTTYILSADDFARLDR